MNEIKAPSSKYLKRLDEARSQPDYWVAKLAYQFAGQINRLIAESGLSRAELARRIGVKASYVTKALRGDGNYTIETMVKMAHALGHRVDVTVRPENEGSQASMGGWESVYVSGFRGLNIERAYLQYEDSRPLGAQSDFSLVNHCFDSGSMEYRSEISVEGSRDEEPCAA